MLYHLQELLDETNPTMKPTKHQKLKPGVASNPTHLPLTGVLTKISSSFLLLFFT